MSDNDFSKKIRDELLAVKEQGYKTSVQKRNFVITLLGLGSLNSVIPQLYQMLYLVPLVAFFFDFLEAEHKFSVRRMGRFLRSQSNDPIERKWEMFVDANRDHVSKCGELGFTVLAFVASILLLHYGANHSFDFFDIAWFSVLAIIYIIFYLAVRDNLRKLNEYPLDAPHPVP